MASQLRCLILIVQLVVLNSLVCVTSVSAAVDRHSRPSLAGGWEDIKDPSDPHVQEIGSFAVAEHNKQTKATLKFQRVVKGQTQVVAGINYRLIVAANDGAGTKDYEAVVWEKTWENFRKLTSFKQV